MWRHGLPPSEPAREELSDEQAALRSMATLVAPSVPPGESCWARPGALLDVDGARVVLAWGEAVEASAVIAQPDRRAARNCGDVRTWKPTDRPSPRSKHGALVVAGLEVRCRQRANPGVATELRLSSLGAHH